MISFSKKRIPYSHWEYLNEENGNRLRIVPERGGLISEWRCNGKEILYLDQKRFSQKAQSVRGGIPVLFPICGDLPGDCLSLLQGDYRMQQHGFARDSQWEIRLLEDQLGIGLSMQDSNLTRASFPYSFLLDMKVRLNNDSLDIKISIKNTSNTIMPFSFGLHPYFNISAFENVTLEGLNPRCLNQVTMLEEDTNELMSNMSDGIDVMVFNSQSVKIIDTLHDHCIELNQSAPFDLTVVWTDPPRSMICIEPWTSPRRSLITGERKLVLEPSSEYHLGTSIIYHRKK